MEKDSESDGVWELCEGPTYKHNRAIVRKNSNLDLYIRGTTFLHLLNRYLLNSMCYLDE